MVASGNLVVTREDTSPAQAKPFRIKRDLIVALNEAAMRYWHRRLLRTPHALEYLASRGFADPEALAIKYQIGYAPTREDGGRGFVLDLMRRGRFPGIEDRDQLERVLLAAGLAKRVGKSGRLVDFFYGRLVFPIVDRGTLADLRTMGAQVVGFGGRWVPRSDPAPAEKGDSERRSPPKWLNTPETPIFKKKSILYGFSWGYEAIKASRQVILLEGYLDVIQAHEAGFHEAVATLGTSLTSEHIAKLPPSTQRKRLSVLICTDDDPAGHRSAYRSAALIFKERPDAAVRIARPPQGLDPDDLIRLHGPEAFRRILDAAMSPVARYLADSPPGRSAAGLAGLIEDGRALRGRLSPDPTERIEDLKAVHRWLREHHGVVVPVHTLDVILRGSPSFEES